ncbi:MAG: hypothetical protein HYZ96_01415 [Candidatus Omnitrophica bacterium]|nr:hypothetical protein [Candidatus Omnitrophota bacterium]
MAADGVVRRVRAAFAVVVRPTVLCLPFLAAFSAFYLLSWPIVRLDTDLWFHLSTGRYIVEHLAIPRETFFSFLSPPRPWLDYSWLFQVMAYAIHEAAGYHGLLILRTATYLLTVALTCRLLLKGRSGHPAHDLYAIVVCALYLVVLAPRHYNVRPHLFTYLFTVTCLSAFEFRSRWLLALPLVGVLWSNLHGITHPVLLLICGAYGLEELLRRRGPSAGPPGPRPILLPALLTAASVVATPHGLRLLALPFRSLEHIGRYIKELVPFRWSDLTSLEVIELIPSVETFRNLLFLLIALTLLAACARRSLRVSHAILFAGAAALLSKGNRFTVEFALLSLPLLRAMPLVSSHSLARAIRKPVYLALLTLAMWLPVVVLGPGPLARPTYPFSFGRLPEGVARFLNRLDVSGRVLNDPDSAGYLRWRLDPRYAIFLDMEFPNPFSAEDLHVGRTMFTDREVFGSITREYEPAFLTVSLATTEFPDLIKTFPEYALVFFDDVEAVYINRRLHPAVADRDELTVADPFTLTRKDAAALLDEAAPPRLLEEMLHLLDVFPEGRTAGLVAAGAAMRTGRVDQALWYAETLIRHYPELEGGYYLKGRALAGAGRWPEALTSYRMAMGRARGSSWRRLSQELGLVFLAQHQYLQAHRAFESGQDFLSEEVSPSWLYRRVIAALLAGSGADGRVVLHHLARKVPKEDPAWRRRLERLSALAVGQRLDEAETEALVEDAVSFAGDRH